MKLAIVAGEASGDLHASEVVRELKKVTPSLEMFGIGGDLLAREGMTLLHHASEMGIVGLFNVVRHLPMFRRVFNELMEKIEREKLKGAVNVTRFKGLGEMNPSQLRESTIHPDTRRLVQLTNEDDSGTRSLMDMLLAKKRASDRKAWLEQKGDLASLEV